MDSGQGAMRPIFSQPFGFGNCVYRASTVAVPGNDSRRLCLARPQTLSPSALQPLFVHALRAPHSITSSARARTVGGIVRPSALAVLRLITSSSRVGRWIGRSAGLAPSRTRPT